MSKIIIISFGLKRNSRNKEGMLSVLNIWCLLTLVGHSKVSNPRLLQMLGQWRPFDHYSDSDYFCFVAVHFWQMKIRFLFEEALLEQLSGKLERMSSVPAGLRLGPSSYSLRL